MGRGGWYVGGKIMRNYKKFKRFFDNNNIPYREIENDNPNGNHPTQAIHVGSTKFLFHPNGNFEGILYPDINFIYKEIS